MLEILYKNYSVFGPKYWRFDLCPPPFSSMDLHSIDISLLFNYFLRMQVWPDTYTTYCTAFVMAKDLNKLRKEMLNNFTNFLTRSRLLFLIGWFYALYKYNWSKINLCFLYYRIQRFLPFEQDDSHSFFLCVLGTIDEECNGSGNVTYLSTQRVRWYCYRLFVNFDLFNNLLLVDTPSDLFKVPLQSSFQCSIQQDKALCTFVYMFISTVIWYVTIFLTSSVQCY